MECDLVVRGGTVVTAAAHGVADVGIRDGAIAQLGGEMRGRREIDASDQYVVPGGVDIHVHLSQAAKPVPGRELWVDDFFTGSQAAIAGGITTIGNMTFQWAGERLRDALERDLEAARRDALVDYVLHPVLTEPTPGAVAEVAGLAAQGHTSLKLFMSRDNFDAEIDMYLRAMRAAAESGLIVLMHCED